MQFSFTMSCASSQLRNKYESAKKHLRTSAKRDFFKLLRNSNETFTQSKTKQLSSKTCLQIILGMQLAVVQDIRKNTIELKCRNVIEGMVADGKN
jgi:hypothetical protein